MRSQKGVPIAVGGIADHVHILAKIPATVAMSDLVQRLKGGSSKWLNEQPWRECAFAWQRGYAAFSVSSSMVPHVAAYILRQEDHHRRTDFMTELPELLKKHGISFDASRLFD